MFKLKSLKYLSNKLLAALFLVCTASCGTVSQMVDNYNNPDEGGIRIVDLQGNHHPTKRYVPEFNARILASNNVPTSQNSGNAQYSEAEIAVTPNVNHVTNSLPLDSKVRAGKVDNDPVPAEIEYDMTLSNTPPVIHDKEVVKSAVKKPKVKKKSYSVQKRLFVQIGSYSTLKSANLVLAKKRGLESGKVNEIEYKNKKIYRVLLGPFSDQETANSALKNAMSSGHKDAFIVKSR